MIRKRYPLVLRARIEIVLSAILGTATIATAAWPAWVEGLLRLDPDGGNGTAEWLIVAALAAATVAAAALARRDLRIVRRRASAGTP
jgi:hypothetical protein